MANSIKRELETEHRRAFPMTPILRKAGYLVPDVILEREGFSKEAKEVKNEQYGRFGVRSVSQVVPENTPAPSRYWRS